MQMNECVRSEIMWTDETLKHLKLYFVILCKFLIVTTANYEFTYHVIIHVFSVFDTFAIDALR
jgi:hypothetical protein